MVTAMPMRNPFERFGFGDLYRERRQPMPFLNQQAPPENPIGKSLREWGTFEMDAPRSSVTEGGEQRESEWGSYLREMKDLYTKEGPAVGAYREHLSSMPTYSAPGKMGRLAAALTGVSEGLRSGGAAGFNAAQGAIQAPYRQSLEQWGTKEQALGRQADIEDEGIQRRLGFMKEARQLSRDERDYRQKMLEFDLDVEKFESDQNYKQAQIQNWRRQGYDTFTDENGDLWRYDPSDPEGTKMKIGGTSKKKDWAFQTDESRRGWANVGISSRNAQTSAGQLAVAQGREKRLTEEAAQGAPISSSDQATAREIAIQRAIAVNPDWRNYVDENGNFNWNVARKYRQGFKDFMEEIQRIENEGSLTEPGIFNRRRSRTPIIE